VSRIVAVALLALFCFSLLEAAVFTTDDESKVPSCCRRGGKHHCTTMIAEAGSLSGPSIQPSKCRFYPGVSVMTASPNTGLLIILHVGTLWMMSCPVFRSTIDTPYQVSFCSTCQKRGPPGLLLL
jgi:hypothetical protein